MDLKKIVNKFFKEYGKQIQNGNCFSYGVLCTKAYDEYAISTRLSKKHSGKHIVYFPADFILSNGDVIVINGLCYTVVYQSYADMGGKIIYRFAFLQKNISKVCE
ncbi:MAG: hypothetical protein RSE93_04280 [Oscillospiraceae bacterium]